MKRQLTFFSTWERPWRGAMKPWKLSGAQQQASWNSRASWKRVTVRTRNTAGEWQAARRPEAHQLRCDGQARRGQGLKILAREEILISAGSKLSDSRTVWLRDCLTPQAALAETFVSAGALVFWRNIAVTVFSDPICHSATALFSVAHTRTGATLTPASAGGSADPVRN